MKGGDNRHASAHLSGTLFPTLQRVELKVVGRNHQLQRSYVFQPGVPPSTPPSLKLWRSPRLREDKWRNAVKPTPGQRHQKSIKQAKPQGGAAFCCPLGHPVQKSSCPARWRWLNIERAQGISLRSRCVSAPTPYPPASCPPLPVPPFNMTLGFRIVLASTRYPDTLQSRPYESATNADDGILEPVIRRTSNHNLWHGI